MKNGSDTLEYTYDTLGNITTASKNGIVIEQYSYSKGICGNESIGIWGFSAQGGISIDTKGNVGFQGTFIGGSINIPIPAPVTISAGREFNIIPDSKKDRNYYGVSSFKGIAPSIPGVEVHAEWGKTESLSYEFNVFNVMYRAYVRIMEW